MKQKKAKTIDEYNQYAKEKKPRYVLIIDEYAELKRTVKEQDADPEALLIDLARCASQTGIHLIVATQGARSYFLSKSIKLAIPARACLAIADSREANILSAQKGVGRLAGDGDMIITADEEDPGLFIQAAFAPDEDIDRVVDFLKNETFC